MNTNSPRVNTPIPERPETIAAQLGWLAEGKRPAVLITPGGELPTVPPECRLEITSAGVFIYHPERVTREALVDAVATNRLGDVLGYGIPAKPTDILGAVVIRNAAGLELLSVVTDQQHLAPVWAAAEAVKGPDDSITLENCDMVIERRVDLGPLGRLPQLRPVQTNADLARGHLAATADGQTLLFPTHVVEKRGEIVGLFGINSLPLFRVWMHSTRTDVRDTLLMLNAIENVYRLQRQNVAATLCWQASPYYDILPKLGYKPGGEFTLFIKQL